MAKSRQQLINASSFLSDQKEQIGGLNVKRSTITADSFKKGTSQESSDNIENRVTANEKKITLLKKVVKLRKQNVDKKMGEGGSPLLESLQSIASTVDSIRDTLIKQQDNDKSVAESMRREKEEDERKGQEKGLESGRPKILQKIGDTVMKPVMSLWDRIFGFLKTLFLGKILMNFIDWFSNPANQGKIQTLVRFVKDWWPALTAAVLLFGTGFGGLVAGLIKTIMWFIPAMGKAIVALKSAKFMKMIPGGGKIGAIAKVAAPLALAGGVGYGIGRMQGGDDQQEQPQEFNKGGQVPGSGPNKDTVPAMLTPGEFVMSRGAVEQYGVDTLEGMNAAAGGTNIPTLKKVEIPQYNEGGLIMEEDLIEVNKERALQGLPPLDQLLGYDKLPYQTTGEMQKAAAYKGERKNESTNVSTNLENMMRTVTKTVNGETTTETYKLSNEEAEALLKKKGYPSMKLADGSVVVDSASYLYDKAVELLTDAYKNGDPEKIAEFEADPDFVEMWKSIEDGSLRKEIIANSRKHKRGTKENLMQKNMNRILEIDGDETVDLMNFNGGGLVQGLNGGGLVDEHNRLRMLRNRIKPGPDGQWSKEDKKKRDQLSLQIQKIHDQIIAQNASQKSTPTTQTPVNDKKSKRGKSGIGRLIGGTADQLTGNLFDFDKRSGGGLIRKTAGALARPVGGLADQLTGNLFDFDKKSGGGLIRKTAGAVGGLFGGGKKEGGSKGGSTGGRLKDRPQVQALREQAKPFMNQGKVTVSSNNASGTPQRVGSGDQSTGGAVQPQAAPSSGILGSKAAPSSGILGPISSNVNAMVNTDKYVVSPKKPQNTVVAYEQAVNEEQQQSQEATSGGNEIPSFTLRPDFMVDEAKVDVLGIMV